MKLIITEKNFEETAGKAWAAQTAGHSATLSEGAVEDGMRKNAVVEMLPKVLAKRVAHMVPEGMVIGEIALTVGFEGTPFGVGLTGEASFKFIPK